MAHPKDRLFRLLQRLKQHFDENEPTRIQVALLALFFALLAWIAGVLAGSVLAFLVVALAPSGPDSGWPAVYTLVGTTLLVGIAGSVRAWKLYQQKISAD